MREARFGLGWWHVVSVYLIAVDARKMVITTTRNPTKNAFELFIVLVCPALLARDFIVLHTRTKAHIYVHHAVHPTLILQVMTSR